MTQSKELIECVHFGIGLDPGSHGGNRFPTHPPILCGALAMFRVKVPKKRPMERRDGVLGFGSDNFVQTPESGSDNFSPTPVSWHARTRRGHGSEWGR